MWGAAAPRRAREGAGAAGLEMEGGLGGSVSEWRERKGRGKGEGGLAEEGAAAEDQRQRSGRR